MHYRPLGKTGLLVSEIGHGTWAMGSMWGERNDVGSLQSLRQSLEQGVNFIDTAYLYGQGHSERLIGQILRESNLKPFVATKCPPNIRAWPPKPGTPADEAFSAKHLVETTEKSLKNLGVDGLDLQQLHVWRPEWLGQGEWLEAVAQLKRQGKIRYFGVSLNDHDADSGLELVASGLVDTIQVIFNLFEQRPRQKLFPLCQQHQVGVIARVPLDEGGLSGTLGPKTQFPKGDWRVKYFAGHKLRETLEHAAQFNFLLQENSKTLAQAALQFCLSEPAVSTVIVGMRRLKHVQENTLIPQLPPLTSAELEKIYSLAWPKNFYPSFG